MEFFLMTKKLPPKRRNPAATALADRRYAPKTIPNKAKRIPRKAKHKENQE
jgi:hypothetical protein